MKQNDVDCKFETESSIIFDERFIGSFVGRS